MILTAKHAEHINDRHVCRTQHLRTAKFFLSLKLSATLGLLSRRTKKLETINQSINKLYLPSNLQCSTQVLSDGVELLDQGWRSGHGRFYLYTFDVGKFVGTDPWGNPCREIALYFPAFSEKFQIITAYPFTITYYNFLWVGKVRFSFRKSTQMALLRATKFNKSHDQFTLQLIGSMSVRW